MPSPGWPIKLGVPDFKESSFAILNLKGNGGTIEPVNSIALVPKENPATEDNNESKEYYWEIYNDPQHMIRTTLDPKTREIGLRKFVRMVQGELQIACLEKYDD